MIVDDMVTQHYFDSNRTARPDATNKHGLFDEFIGGRYVDSVAWGRGCLENSASSDCV
jgi:hypothetical protein